MAISSSIRIYNKNGNLIISGAKVGIPTYTYSQITTALDSNTPIEFLEDVDSSVSWSINSQYENSFPINEILGYTDISNSTTVKYENYSIEHLNFIIGDLGATCDLYVILESDVNTTWKQVVYDAADAYRTASATTANVKVGELAQKISTLEDVTAEVTTQTPLIEDIKESLVGKATGANATEDTILEGYSAYVGQELVEGKYKPLTFGYSSIDSGVITPASDTFSIFVAHSLGVIPSTIMIVTPYDFSQEETYNAYSCKILCVSTPMKTKEAAMVTYNGYNLEYEADTSVNEYVTINEDSFSFEFSNNTIITGFRGGKDYYWIAMA